MDKPNIVFILADDLGYGDVRCLNPDRCRLATPNLDRLAAEGMTFTDAHATSSVCTPSRYSILTGRYNWRSRLQSMIVSAEDPPLISSERLTVAELLRKQGYATACVGKWHVGLNWYRDEQGEIDYSKPFTGGPVDRGFDWYFGNICPGVPPHGFIENDRLIGEATETSPPEMTRWGGRGGPMVPGFTFEQMLPTQTDQACGFIGRKVQEETPFFLYLSLNAPHSPVTPNREWLGTSGIGQYGDFVQEMDHEVGRLIDRIDELGVKDNTLIVFTSDNGCTSVVGTDSEYDADAMTKRHFKGARVLEMEALGHYPSAHMRGYKSDAWDGGHRVPFLVRWPSTVNAGTTCDALVSLMDFMATCAGIHDAPLPDDAAEDSFSLLPLLKGESTKIRELLVHHSFYGKFAIREGKWKLMLCPGSGGWWKPTDWEAKDLHFPRVQLYDMETDPGEQHNLQAEHPEIVERLTARLEELVAKGRSTPGPPQPNDAEIDIWKWDAPRTSMRM